MMQNDVSIASYSFHGLIAAGQMNVFGYLESCRYRYHLNTADIWNGLLGSDPKTYLQDGFIAAVASGLRQRDLYLANYHADDCHVWEADAEQRAAHELLALAHLRAAAAMGAKIRHCQYLS